MAGLTNAGFEPETLDNITNRIKARLDALNPGFDFSPESPDGQLIDIIGFELFQAWNQLSLVYDSYNPAVASGASLRNIGTITGIPFGVANRSFASVETQGTAGTIIPQGSLVTNTNGDDFYTAFEAIIPGPLTVVAVEAGRVDVSVGAITDIKTPVPGWTGIAHTIEGQQGSRAMTEQQYRNFRQRTVMRNSSSVVDKMQARLVELGLGQVRINNNLTNLTDTDGTPPNTIQVSVGEIGNVSTQDIARVILNSNSPGCPTYGTSSEFVTDSQGVTHEVFFTVASAVDVEIHVDVTFLDDNIAGAAENITNSLFDHVNSLLTDEDVIWSRLFGYIIPYGKAQVNSLQIAKVGDALGEVNIPIEQNEYAALSLANIFLTVDGDAP